jgi:hypothetical protein
VDGSHCPLLQQHTQGDQEGLANVTAYPQGASPFGVLDLVGNVRRASAPSVLPIWWVTHMVGYP